jgi:hypothetical protein
LVWEELVEKVFRALVIKRTMEAGSVVERLQVVKEKSRGAYFGVEDLLRWKHLGF